MRRSNLNRFKRILVGWFLVLLFCGYFGSITFFPHTHIVDGITIVHSHPYKSHSGNNPISHNHSKNGFLLLQFVSSFITTIPVLFFGVIIIRPIINLVLRNQDENVILNFYLSSANRPRAPAL
jgi:hypothetical protein